jgi:hypothetical protein
MRWRGLEAQQYQNTQNLIRMTYLQNTEKLSDGTQQELCISDAISRLFSKVEILFGKENEDTTYKIERYDDGIWVVKHNYIPYERDDVERVIRLNDL